MPDKTYTTTSVTDPNYWHPQKETLKPDYKIVQPDIPMRVVKLPEKLEAAIIQQVVEETCTEHILNEVAKELHLPARFMDRDYEPPPVLTDAEQWTQFHADAERYGAHRVL